MTEETIVAVYDTAAHAEAAIADLRAAQVPETAISRHAGQTDTSGVTTQPVREQGFWASLFGGETEHDTAVYDRSLDTGSSVVVVKGTPGHDVEAVMAILERHSPIDIDERGAGYELTSANRTTATAATTTSVVSGGAGSGFVAPLGSDVPPVGTAPAVPGGRNETIQLAEEQLAVGKRIVNRGGTRIRRYVVETPVEESISLHDEKVTLERRPVSDGRPITDGSFSEKVIEMTESAEEAVISKTAHVVEEVGLRKEAVDRIETVHDIVRKEQVEVDQVPGNAATTVGTSQTTPKPL